MEAWNVTGGESLNCFYFVANTWIMPKFSSSSSSDDWIFCGQHGVSNCENTCANYGTMQAQGLLIISKFIRKDKIKKTKHTLLTFIQSLFQSIANLQGLNA